MQFTNLLTLLSLQVRDWDNGMHTPLTRLDQVLGGDADGPLLLLLDLALSQNVLKAGVEAALGKACRGMGEVCGVSGDGGVVWWLCMAPVRTTQGASCKGKTQQAPPAPTAACMAFSAAGW